MTANECRQARTQQYWVETASSLESEQVWVAWSLMPRRMVSEKGEHMPNTAGGRGAERLPWVPAAFPV